MTLAVSAIAWDESEEAQAFAALERAQVSEIELVPHRVRDAKAYRASLAAHDLKPVSFQALLFGTKDLALFETEERREALARHLEGLCDLAGELGVRALVFGSPKNRFIPEGMTPSAARSMALEFFGRIGERARAGGTALCLEPNPAAYGANFLLTTAETLALVRELDHPGVRLNLDLGAIRMNDEPVESTLRAALPWAGHLHLSEPMLAPVGTGDASRHHDAARALRTLGHAGTISIEMARPKTEPAWSPVESAIAFTKRIYGAR